jgi:transposase InsO family protein
MVYSRAVKVSVLKKVLPPNNESIVYLCFRDLEHARDWMADFVNWYNTEHLHLSK